VLRQIVLTFHPKEIDVSSYGIREGLLYEQMPERLRLRDPLIEACRHAERTMARMPGFGKKLFQFILPIFRDLPENRLRIVKAACLLHDTTWRAHPDYRAEACFDNATRANLGGLSHPERVYLGLALLHRYKNSRAGSRMAPLFALLDDHQLREAEVLGKAMRFGAMFAVRSPEDAGEIVWRQKKKSLELRLNAVTQALFGEVAEARFNSLAEALAAEAKVTVVPA
jgi:exopolyphosphatase/guanosine-5'-triphosphate,3'-diphosphate pyrophosphatase